MKRIYTIILAAFMCIGTITAQVGTVAPNFEATDVHGNTHNLYEYLDQGKTVILDFFFTTCIPCQFYTPQVNLAFEKYGCNMGDVVFISIDYEDTDAQVIAYEQEYDIHYPSISGVEGGGNAIVQDYGIQGFPTFFVVSPSKEIVSRIDPPTIVVFDDELGKLGIAPQSCTSSTSEVAAVNTFSVIPNPVSSGSTVYLSNIDIAESRVANLYDMMGKKVLSQKGMDAQSQLELPFLPKGLYMLEIKDELGGMSYISKIVVQ